MKNMFPSVVLTFVALLLFSEVASGQVTDAQRDRRRQFVGDLMKTLIESQMNRNPVQPQPGRPNLRPFPDHGHKPSLPLTPNMINARQHCEAWENESAQLVKMMRKEERRLPRVRPLLADALATHASIKAFGVNLGQTHTLDPLTDCFCDLDAQWRLLNHQLMQVRGLQPECTACMNRISEYDTLLCGLFEVQPQFNRPELSRYCTQMASSFQHLIQDVRYDMQGDPNYNDVLRDCQKIYTRLNEADRLISRGSHDSIVRIYNRCLADWREVRYKLISCPHGRIQRNVHQIETIGGHMAELLWIQPDIDRTYLCQVISNMEREVAVAFKNVSLHDLLQCKTPGVVLACSREFQNHCSTLSTRLSSDADVESLMWDFKQLSNQWQDLNGHLSAFTTPRIGRSVGQIDSGFQVLQGTFGDGPLIDRATMADICSDLDQLSYRMIDLAQQNKRRGGYEKSFHNDFCECTNKFHQSIHQMHEHVLADRRHDAHASQDVTSAVSAWADVRPMINKCKPEHRQEMNQIRSRIEPLMVKLQVVFSD